MTDTDYYHGKITIDFAGDVNPVHILHWIDLFQTCGGELTLNVDPDSIRTTCKRTIAKKILALGGESDGYVDTIPFMFFCQPGDSFVVFQKEKKESFTLMSMTVSDDQTRVMVKTKCGKTFDKPVEEFFDPLS